ncbi:TonB-dependent receptor [Massilia forsythiae]|uniref:TonB-dependent receptor n=1 Tax=Massilia forsythiae TaxID=2728020 RepID=A0A7Z2ZSX9_9BURK|nr:TonB-dependent receptor [Massilia forsythiae]QJE00774.1 TonB-dependent receptor [Massilia forsythiae]
MNLFANQRSGSRAFALSPVAAGCAVFMALAGQAAYAQDNTSAGTTANTEAAAATGATNSGVTTVKVTGIRRGIEAAISVKKNNDSIVEAISAEDIGKLPDQSIAESISRLPGLTAQRDIHGNASVISIRGMSPDFSTGLLNGREQVSTGDSRSIEFDQYPGELLSGVVIYKTPDANLVGQGLSGTVDLQTVRPLDFSKRTMAVNYRREKSGLGMDKKGHGNRFTFSYIDQFADRQVGIAFGFARLQGVGGDTSRFESWGNGTTTYQGRTVNVPYNGFNAFTETYSQERNGFMGVVQYRPSKTFSSTVDLFYSKYDRNTRNRGIQMPLNDTTSNAYDQPGQLINATLSGNNVTSGSFNNVRAVLRNDVEAWSDTTKSIGWNNKLKLDQDWTASLDLSFNSAERSGINIETYGSGTSFDTVGFTAGSRNFTTQLNYADPNTVRLTDPQGWGGADIQAGYVKFPHVYDKLNAVRFDVSRDLPDGWFFSKLSAGVNKSNRSKTREYTENLASIKGTTSPFASAPYPSGSGSGMAGDTGINVITFDPVASLNDVYTLRGKQHPDIFNKDWIVSEDVSTAFAKLGIDSQLGAIPVRGALGAQLVHTKQDSTAYSVDTNGGSGDTSRPTGSFKDGTSYNDFLPSLNLIGDLGSQQSLRFSLSKIMARPTLNDMRASSSFGYDTTRQQFSGSGGNPKLKPFRAKAIDVSYEKYWDSKAYVSAAVFYKKLDTYIVNAGQTYDFTPRLLPTSFQAPTNIGIYTSPVNGSGGNLKGVELAASLPLNLVTRYLDGFGVVVNGSQNSSAVSLPNTANGGSGTMDLPGLSKRVASLTVYYEKNGFSARAAERYRSDFIGEVATNTGDRELTYIQGEKVVDLQFGYEIQDGPAKGLSLLVQMNNVNDSHFIRYRQTKDNVIEDRRFGRSVMVGLNYKL